MDLPTLWFALAVTCWVLFFVLEGFDFGVGVLAGALGRDDHERGAGVTTIGPVWDGNEVWLVAAVGVTFAAFPDWYAALMSGLYLPFVLILLALAARGVALEFRSKGGTARWRAACDGVLAGSSLLVAALWGAVLGVLATGLALGADGEVVGSGLGRSVAPLVSTPALVGAALGVGVALVQGATFLGLRTTGPLRARARVAALGALVPVAVLAVAVAPLGLVAVGVVAVLVADRREVLAFAATSVAVAGGVVAVLAAHLPVVLPSTLDPAFSLTVAGAAASPGALRLITIAAVLVLPGVVAYQAFSYWVFRRRVASERVAT
ncbi:cytochrome d ubiquinol oxidase subunit II [Actinomycetospora chibensis]|uniref:Cytochrome d ubiquinol oxidase subunit II n=1 Tax=Actinomycetospora chibensis TaxID=663606 RepID=A0ABV9RK17_9PSEU|nr:cytochrome d ubiquinol oxidase subunit II [Actinomycetospora chibensis]MDD7924705.1 cytochrome d ubiquinol oxidase subunit II [Actinomycetospora chibensis]